MHPRLYRLIEVHQHIDSALRIEMKRPLPGSFQVIRLKKLKLRAKDLIERLTRRFAHG